VSLRQLAYATCHDRVILKPEHYMGAQPARFLLCLAGTILRLTEAPMTIPLGTP
jgi:hypothetical protein